ncbi:unnamed protein product [Bursaphelenchus okinawaensis]|uniref:glucuronosyltransferase n=1 Tax=Bursaphelenchus okinawaensis TaxID=465554 RepID=A0A811K2Z3_9BILA|nr:unnamed protein product [Bursaphelenchus okinawaensis]CAG9090198.1 unnamed protein product [Bursaphelenchus okinawaensis]
MKKAYNVILTLFIFAQACYGYNILFYNAARLGQSHVFFSGKLADWLVEAGHNVTFYQQHMFDSVSKTGVKLAKTYVRPPHNITVDDFDSTNFWYSENEYFLEHFGIAQAQACKSQLRDNQLIEQIKSENYDFAVVEFIDFCAYAIIEKAGIKNYATTSPIIPIKGIFDALGLPLGIGVVPGWYESFSKVPTYYERAKALFEFYKSAIYMTSISTPVISAIQNLHDSTFNPNEKIGKSSYIYMNIDEHLTFQTPITSKMIFVGGIGAQNRPVAKLSPDYKNIFNSAKRGVVLISFGTALKTNIMPEKFIQAIVSMAKRNPDINFIWKYDDNDNIGANVTNLYKRKWIPQHDVLANPKLLAFITHGGLNSIVEATELGVPTVCMPIFGDQHMNCQAVQSHGLSITIEKTFVTTSNLKMALNRVLKDQKIHKKVRRMADLINNKPFTPKEQFAGLYYIYIDL